VGVTTLGSLWAIESETLPSACFRVGNASFYLLILSDEPSIPSTLRVTGIKMTKLEFIAEVKTKDPIQSQQEGRVEGNSPNN